MFLKKEMRIINIFLCLAFLSCFHLFRMSLINKLGFISILLIFITIFGFACIKFKKIKIDFLFIAFTIFFMINFINLIFKFNFSALYVFLQQTALLLVPVVISNTKITKESKQLIENKLSTIFIIMTAFFVLEKLFGSPDQVISITIYKILYAGSYFILKRFKNIFTFLILMAVFFFLGERTSLMIYVIVFLLYHIFRKAKLSRKTLIRWSSILITSLVFLPFIYVFFSETEIGQNLNVYIIEITGESLFSGRDKIWKTILYNDNKIFGYGLGNNYLQINGISLSTHNLFLYIILQGGYVTLGAFIIYIVALVKKTNKDYLAFPFLIGIFILSNFELLLLVNNMAISIWLWLVIASITIKVKDSSENKLDTNLVKEP